MKWRKIKSLTNDHLNKPGGHFLFANGCNGPSHFYWTQLHEAYRYPGDDHLAEAIKDEGVWTHWAIIPDLPASSERTRTGDAA
jgi:hypothetical protein